MWPFPRATEARPLYRRIDPDFAVAAQVSIDDLVAIAEAGFRTIVCVRPDNEESGQPRFATIAAAARKIGLEAIHIPVAGGIGKDQLTGMEQALKSLPTPMLGYCRSGARAASLYHVTKSLP